MDPSYPGTKMEYLPSYSPDGIIHNNYSSFRLNGSDIEPDDDEGSLLMNLVLLPMSILIVCTFLGNALVLIAVYRERSLKSMSNYVIASLALADLLLSVLVMPLSLISVVRGGWGFGLALCVTHLSLDVLLCTASILHLCAIAVNRYLAVTFPLMYSRDRVNSQKRILGTIIPVWVVSIAICAPLFIQGFINPEKTLSEDGQACGFFDKTFIIYSSMGSFYVPLAVMIVVDVRAVRKLRGRKALAASAQRCMGQAPPPQPSPTRECVSRSRSSTPPPPPSPDKTYLTVQGNGAPPSPGNDYRKRPLRISFHMNRKSGQKLGYGSTVVEAVPDTRQKMLSNKREKRAAKTLVVVFACFIILWLPFFVMHLANGFCTTCQIPDELFIAFTWLGYLSSAFNPAIYTCFNKEYRRAFIRIICCGKKRRYSFRLNETSTFRSSLRHS